MKAALTSSHLGDTTVEVVSIAEHQRRRRTRLHAGRRQLAILVAPSLAIRAFLSLPYALDTKRAFLHDAPGAHRHIRIELFGQGLIPVGIEPVELPDRIRAIVSTVPNADAPVVNLRVEPIGRMVGGVDRTDGLARR